jgi:predicted enzyme related to lactoylglutathione lyase
VLVALQSLCSFAFAQQSARYYPGKFVWFDLVTDDPAALRQFYAAVFGWQFRTVGKPPASYTLIENAGDSIGGMFYHERPAGASASARWLSLISVPDPAQSIRYVEQHGGKVIAPLTKIAGRGTHALLRDPQGAVFGVLKSASGDRPDTPVETGDFFWVDLLAADPAKATAFYGGLAGYETSDTEVSGGVKRVMLSSGGYARAGIVPLPPPVKQPGWLPYVLVDDVAATLDKAAAAGGSVVVKPRADLLDGNLAVIADPRGGIFGIVRWDAETDSSGDQSTTSGATQDQSKDGTK